MPLDTKRLPELNESDILELITNGVEEGKEIDYKERLQIGPDSEKKEFLADVSSFANASGGHLVFGIEEAKGVPINVKPLTIQNWDAERLRLESMVRDGISPRLSMELTAIPVAPSGQVIVLRIPRSWSGPHMITFQNTGKFYSRNSGGKYQLDVGELRTAFTAGAQVAEAIRAFRLERLSAIVSGETPIRLPDGPKVIVHCCPYTSTALGAAIDLQEVYRQTALVKPIFPASSYAPGFNLDGVFSYAPDRKLHGAAYSYCQVFRDGKVELVESRLFRTTDGIKLIPSESVEGALIGCVSRMFRLFRVLEVEPPAAFMITFLGVKSYVIGVHPLSGYASSEIDRDALVLPPDIANSYDLDAAFFLKPALDALWNAGGMSQCGDYDGAGQPSQALQTAIRQLA